MVLQDKYNKLKEGDTLNIFTNYEQFSHQQWMNICGEFADEASTLKSTHDMTPGDLAALYEKLQCLQERVMYAVAVADQLLWDTRRLVEIIKAKTIEKRGENADIRKAQAIQACQGYDFKGKTVNLLDLESKQQKVVRYLEPIAKFINKLEQKYEKQLGIIKMGGY